MIRRHLPPYVETRPGRKGQTYHYFRRKPAPPIRMHSAPGTPEFAAEYARLLSGAPPPPPGRSFRALIRSYKQSPRFARLAPRTKSDYLKVLDAILDAIGDLPADKMRRVDVVRLRDANAGTPRFATYAVQVLRILFEHARDIGWRDDNPATGVSGVKGDTAERQPWPADSIAAYRAAADGKALLIFELLHGTGQRIGDVLRMRWDDLADGGIWVRQGKTKARLWVPLTPALAAVLAEAPREGLTIVTARHGRPMSYRGAHQIVMAVRVKIGAEAHDLHGLRYSAASELAAAGCTDEQIQAITGHTTTAMVRRYAGAARQKVRAKEAQERRK